MKKLVVLSGAGISAESGISTFRDKGGLWEGHDVMEVASPAGWEKDPALVLDFYNKRRRQLREVNPNDAHYAITGLQDNYDVKVITQNVDDLHERAGNLKVLHLHGELFKVRSCTDPGRIYEWKDDLKIGDKCEAGSQLRPHIVWFGELVPEIPKAAELISDAEIVVIVGTSLQVYPAAGLISYAPPVSRVYYIDPRPYMSYELKSRPHEIIRSGAVEGMKKLLQSLNNSPHMK